LRKFSEFFVVHLKKEFAKLLGNGPKCRGRSFESHCFISFGRKRAKSAKPPTSRFYPGCAKTTLSRCRLAAGGELIELIAENLHFTRGGGAGVSRAEWNFIVCRRCRGFDMRNQATVTAMRLINVASSNAIRRARMKNVPGGLVNYSPRR